MLGAHFNVINFFFKPAKFSREKKDVKVRHFRLPHWLQLLVFWSGARRSSGLCPLGGSIVRADGAESPSRCDGLKPEKKESFDSVKCLENIYRE